MVLKVYNSLTKKVEDFKPIESGKVSLYTCGPTVYDYAHIGNFRAYLFGDILKRTLIALGYEVNHIMNITDIDDKTIKNSQKNNQSLTNFTEFYTDKFFEDRDSLHIIPATDYTKATNYIKEMLEIVEILLNKGFAYVGEDQSIYFSINKDSNYGKLVELSKDKLKENAGGRIKKDEYEKDNPQDFALWKSWDEEDGDVVWDPKDYLGPDTKIQKGRPGWHIECSAMSMSTLGETIDIHTGGMDNMFPHHENEIAQSECATGKTFANYFMHNGWLLVDGKKMSKSDGSFYTVRDLINKGYSPLSLRYFSFLTNYRSPINFTLEALTASQNALLNIQTFYAINYTSDDLEIDENYKTKFLEALSNDLNTPEAVALIFDVIHNQDLSNNIKIGTLSYFDNVLGLDIYSLVVEEKEEIKDIIKKRDEARSIKDFKESDVLREKLESLGLKVLDTKEGTKVIKQVVLTN